jgi:hypothetical protein
LIGCQRLSHNVYDKSGQSPIIIGQLSGFRDKMSVIVQPCRRCTPDYESGGLEFESLRARQLNQKLRMILPIDPGPFAYLGYTIRYTTALARFWRGGPSAGYRPPALAHGRPRPGGAEAFRVPATALGACAARASCLRCPAWPWRQSSWRAKGAHSRSASKIDPLWRRVLAVPLAPSELVGVAETARARVVG